MEKDWQLQLAPRWQALRAKAPLLGWTGECSPRLHELAARARMKWYEARAADRVADFLCHDADRLFHGLPGFGRIKCQHLIELLEAASSHAGAAEETSNTVTQTVSPNCAEVLQLWGVPPDYPLKLVPLSTRLMNFCEARGVTALSGLLEAWGGIGRAGLLAQENIGRRTVDELQALAHAIGHADAVAVRRWLPLNENEKGLCLRRALGIAHQRHTENERAIVTRRIVDGLKLEEVGQERGITRERVRQLEAAYLKDVEATLEAFAEERQAMLDAWTIRHEWKHHITPLPEPESEVLILAAIEGCFSETPQGMLRRLSAESSLHSWLEAAMTHPDLHLGGFDLQEFLEAQVPIESHEVFINELLSRPALTLDYTMGQVKPTSPCVRDTVTAILAQEEEPIPLTWLARRVQGIEGCEEGDADFILRNRYRWSQLGFLDLAKVLWHE